MEGEEEIRGTMGLGGSEPCGFAPLDSENMGLR